VYRLFGHSVLSDENETRLFASQSNRFLVFFCPLMLLLLFLPGYAAQKSVIQIPSLSMNTSYNALVIAPDEYANSDNRFSVIYLLHGYSGNFMTWSQVAPIAEYSDKYRLIIVCPDGNYNSWYIDSPMRQNSKFESYIVSDVVSTIDKTFRTWSSDRGRAIIGSSMGGHGAATILAKHCDLFCGAGSISGIMDLAEFPSQWDIANVLGDYRANAQVWHTNSFLTLCEKLAGKNKALILDCGMSDFALDGNRKTHEKLIAMGIPHEYYERPGSHTPEYVRRNIEFHFLYFKRILLSPGK
jgi:putative tributyrin esterase